MVSTNPKAQITNRVLRELYLERAAQRGAADPAPATLRANASLAELVALNPEWGGYISELVAIYRTHCPPVQAFAETGVPPWDC